MKKIYVTLIGLFLSTAGWAASLDWNGSWAGKCTLSPAYAGISEFEGSMEIKAMIAARERYQWKMVYDFGGRMPTEVRNYEMYFEGDHYVVDEKNGLLLDSYVNGNTLYSPFAINGQIITARYEFQGERAVIEMPSYLKAPIRKTCLEGNSALCAESLALRRVQKCEFFRQR